LLRSRRRAVLLLRESYPELLQVPDDASAGPLSAEVFAAQAKHILIRAGDDPLPRLN
jgi:hypothetical protein